MNLALIYEYKNTVEAVPALARCSTAVEALCSVQ